MERQRECDAIGVAPWGPPVFCTLPIGHECDHAAHTTMDNRDTPIHTWPYSRAEVSRAT